MKQVTGNRMIKKLIHIISLSLIIILLTPLVTQLFDGLFHHHDKVDLAAHEISLYQNHHKKCPIPGFQLSIFNLLTKNATVEKETYAEILNFKIRTAYFLEQPDYYFLLRAPPAQTT
ncbi:MAG: hypothetical protein JW729_02275 [Bacteroidales bacterium]|nr:hypothetical protein [Bacteroidales bacterium]